MGEGADLHNRTDEKLDLSDNGKSQEPKKEASENLELSPESLDSSLQDIEENGKGQGDDNAPTDDSY